MLWSAVIKVPFIVVPERLAAHVCHAECVGFDLTGFEISLGRGTSRTGALG